MRYAVVYSKGGVGKTTVAVHLAIHLQKQAPTLLIDGDPKERAATWITWRREEMPDAPTPTTVRLLGKAVLDEGREIAANFTHTVIDAAGHDGPGMRNSLLLADRAIIPLGYEGQDTIDLAEFERTLDTAKDFNPGLKVRILLARVHPQSKMDDLVSGLKDLGFDVFNQRIRELMVFKYTGKTGKTVHEYKPRNAAATHDMRMFYDEVEKWT